MPNDRVRIERALEVQALSGRPLSELQREHAFAEERYHANVIHLEPPRAELHARIERRARECFASESPLWQELRALRERIERVPSAAKALKIIGYAEAAEALETGERERACQRTIERTRQYAKRQATWFKKEFGPGEP